VLWWAILGHVLIAGLLVRTGIAYFNREELLGRELDTINLKWMWQIFWDAFTGGHKSVLQWYRHEVPRTLKRIKLPMGFVLLALIVGAWVGANQASVFILPSSALDWSNIQEGFVQGGTEGLEAIRFFSVGSVGMVWYHNIRTIFLATLLGLFSFGVLGVLILMLPFVLIGYFSATVAGVGLSPAIFLAAFVLPHGILEIPAILLAGGALLRLGATLAAPAEGRTMGEALLHSLADWFRMMLAVVIPMFFAAAVLEIFVTPQVAALLLSR
jgi:uncharacterized membrane protein SpoIIM required for sporulation